VPDNEDYEGLRDLLGHPEGWTESEVKQARLLRQSQAEGAAAYDQRDRRRVAAMWQVVGQLDDAIAGWDASH
jgi:hypothetical protein